MQLVETESPKLLIPKRKSVARVEPMLAETRSFSPGEGVRDGDMPPAQKTIRHRDFAQRLERACDSNDYVPEYNKGRLTWISTELKRRFGIIASVETVRKWFEGVMKPKADKLSALAQLLEVDEVWLSMGVEPDLSPREMKARNATADGAVNVLTGFIQIAGGNPAFPSEGDVRARENHIDLYAIIKGAQYAFHVALARDEDDGYRFVVPSTYRDVFVVGAIPIQGPGMTFVELPADVIESLGVRRGNGLDVVLPKSDVSAYLIKSFSERL